MNLRIKRKLDWILGWPLIIGLNLMALILRALLRRSHDRNPVHQILVAKFQGGGSLLIAAPALAQIRQKFPEARLIFWGTRSTLPFAEHLNLFDELLVVEESLSFQSLKNLVATFLKFWKAPPDWAFDLEVYSKLSSGLMAMTLARNRVAFAVNTVALRKGLNTHLIYFNRYAYLGLAYQSLFGLLGGIDYPLETRFFSEPRNSKKLFVVNPNAGPLSLERRWPETHVTQLIQQLLERYPEHEVALIGSGEFEQQRAQSIAKQVQSQRLIDHTGKLSLAQLRDLLESSDLVISNDSAPLHMALASSSRVIGLFGPTHPWTYFPMQRKAAVSIYLQVPCSPCVHHWEPPPCKGRNICMQLISVEQVLVTIHELMRGDRNKERRLDSGLTTQDKFYHAGLVHSIVDSV